MQAEAGAETDPFTPRGEEVGGVGAEGWVGEVEDDRHARIGEAGRVRAGEAIAARERRGGGSRSDGLHAVGVEERVEGGEGHGRVR